MAGDEQHTPPDIDTGTPTLGLLPCLADRHVHIVYNPTDPYPLAVCGVRVVPGVRLDGEPLLCRRCLTHRHRNTQLQPAADEYRHHLAAAQHRRGIGELARRRQARRCDRRIHHALTGQH